MLEEREKFRIYEAIRQFGAYNMIVDSPKVIAFACRVYGVEISREDYIFILKNYSKLKRKWSK